MEHIMEHIMEQVFFPAGAGRTKRKVFDTIIEAAEIGGCAFLAKPRRMADFEIDKLTDELMQAFVNKCYTNIEAMAGRDGILDKRMPDNFDLMIQLGEAILR